jgi:hypothetical protein
MRIKKTLLAKIGYAITAATFFVTLLLVSIVKSAEPYILWMPFTWGITMLMFLVGVCEMFLIAWGLNRLERLEELEAKGTGGKEGRSSG